MANRLRLMPWVAAAALLLLPAGAMTVSGQWTWDAADFLLLGAILFAACGRFELAARKTKSTPYRAAVVVAGFTTSALIWLNLAVGIIGAEDEPANLLFAGVLAVALLGAVLARFRARGMARAMTATAVAQTLIGVGAVAAGLGSGPAVLVLSGIFAALWLASAWLFAQAARQP